MRVSMLAIKLVDLFPKNTLQGQKGVGPLSSSQGRTAASAAIQPLIDRRRIIVFLGSAQTHMIFVHFPQIRSERLSSLFWTSKSRGHTLGT